MNVGVCTVKLHFPGNRSLKEKRRTIKSIITRLRNQYNVSVAEVDAQDLWQLAIVGIACVSNRNHHVSETLSQVINFIIQNYPEVELVDQAVEVFPGS